MPRRRPSSAALPPDWDVIPYQSPLAKRVMAKVDTLDRRNAVKKLEAFDTLFDLAIKDTDKRRRKAS